MSRLLQVMALQVLIGGEQQDALAALWVALRGCRMQVVGGSIAGDLFDNFE